MRQKQPDDVMFGQVQQVMAPVGNIAARTGAKSAILDCLIKISGHN